MQLPGTLLFSRLSQVISDHKNYFKLRINSWALLAPLATKHMKACRAFLRPVTNSRCLAMLALKYAGLDGDPTIGGTCGKPAINDKVFAGDESGA